MHSIVRKGSRVAGTGLVRFITKGLQTREIRKMRNKLYCGDAAYCSRKSVLFATRDGENIGNAAGKFYMETGTTVHRIIQQAFQRSGILVEAERRINLTYKGIELRGMVDAIVEVDDELKVVEIKTCGALPGKPKKEHLHQALTYALITGIYKVVIFYMSRKVASFDGRLECVEFEIDVTPVQLDMVAEILATSFIGTEEKVIPPIPLYIASQGDCGFCPFTKICWGTESKKFPKLKSRTEDKIQKAKMDLLRMSKKARKEMFS